MGELNERVTGNSEEINKVMDDSIKQIAQLDGMMDQARTQALYVRNRIEKLHLEHRNLNGGELDSADLEYFTTLKNKWASFFITPLESVVLQEENVTSQQTSTEV